MSKISVETVEEIGRLHRRLAQSREVLYKIADENLPHTNERLNVVTATTEAAATNLLDGLEAAIAMVDDLQDSEEPAARQKLSDDLRNQLFDLIGHLQFQDIITQQLAYASSVIAEAEARLGTLARNFGVAVDGDDPAEDATGPNTFDPGATMLDQGGRQALADELFTTGRVA